MSTLVTDFDHLRHLRKSGAVDEAYEFGAHLLSESPQPFKVRGIFGWVIYDRIKDLLGSDTKIQFYRMRQLNTLVHQYTRLELPRPDLLLSMLIMRLSQVEGSGELLLQLISQDSASAFRVEDTLPKSDRATGARYSSLIQRAALRIGKDAMSNTSGSVQAAAASFLLYALQKCEPTERHWLEYRAGVLLTSLGRTQEAHELLVAFVGKQRTDYWAWLALARNLKLDNPTDALTACARAFKLCQEPKFRSGVLQELADIARRARNPRIASWAKVNAEAKLAASEAMLPEDVNSTAQELQQLSIRATDLLATDSRWMHACLVPGPVNRSGRSPWMVVVANNDAPGIAGFAPDVAVPRGARSGDLFEALISNPGTDHAVVIDIRSAATESNKALLESAVGIVIRQNSEKSVATFSLGPHDTLLAYYSVFSEAADLELGDPVTVQYYTLGKRILLATMQPTSSLPDSEWFSIVEGTVRMHQRGFGFIDNVFVPPHLAVSIPDGSWVQAMAVQAVDNKRGRLGWQAVKLLP